MNPSLEDLQLLAAEHDAIVRPFTHLLRRNMVPEQQIPDRLMSACLTVGAEAWRCVHPELDEEQAAQIFGVMAVEAVRAFNDARVIMASRRTLKEGEKDHA